jgi:hypothetical protein
MLVAAVLSFIILSLGAIPLALFTVHKLERKEPK